MSRPIVVGSLWAILSGARLALAQDAPPLEPPATDPPPPIVSAPRPAPTTPAPARSDIRPLLVIPGVTAPSRRGVTSPGPKTVQSSAATSDPAAADSRRSLSGARVESTPAPSSGSRIPMTLEPIEDDPAVDPKTPSSSTSRGRGPGWPAGVPPPGARPPGNSTSDPPSAAPAAPRRGSSFFGRFLAPFAPSPSRTVSRNSSSKPEANVDPKSDPATEAATRKKIESEIRDSLGDRLRSVEVRVNGRNVLIVAKPSRFWQKRSVRQSLESMSSLAGYRARVDVID
jgi:hypothetical protein